MLGIGSIAAAAPTLPWFFFAACCRAEPPWRCRCTAQRRQRALRMCSWCWSWTATTPRCQLGNSWTLSTASSMMEWRSSGQMALWCKLASLMALLTATWTLPLVKLGGALLAPGVDENPAANCLYIQDGSGGGDINVTSVSQFSFCSFAQMAACCSVPPITVLPHHGVSADPTTAGCVLSLSRCTCVLAMTVADHDTTCEHNVSGLSAQNASSALLRCCQRLL